MAELADAYGSGPYGLRPMKVQVLSPAPLDHRRPAEKLAGLFLFWARLRRCRASGASWPWRSCALERVIPVRFARGSDGTLGPSQVASKLRTGNFYLRDSATYVRPDASRCGSWLVVGMEAGFADALRGAKLARPRWRDAQSEAPFPLGGLRLQHGHEAEICRLSVLAIARLPWLARAGLHSKTGSLTRTLRPIVRIS